MVQIKQCECEPLIPLPHLEDHSQAVLCCAEPPVFAPVAWGNELVPREGICDGGDLHLPLLLLVRLVNIQV